MSCRKKGSENIPNIEAHKEQFLKNGKLPKVLFKKQPKQGGKVEKKRNVAVSFEFLPEAKRILDIVNWQFENGDNYLDRVFGERISQFEASRYLNDYLRSQGLDGGMRIFWSKDISCCGRIVWTGPDARLNKPEKRKYCLWLKSTGDNAFLRRQGIKGLADHEIGTHYVSLHVQIESTKTKSTEKK